jgi:hypothetical protein
MKMLGHPWSCWMESVFPGSNNQLSGFSWLELTAFFAVSERLRNASEILQNLHANSNTAPTKSFGTKEPENKVKNSETRKKKMNQPNHAGFAQGIQRLHQSGRFVPN